MNIIHAPRFMVKILLTYKTVFFILSHKKEILTDLLRETEMEG